MKPDFKIVIGGFNATSKLKDRLLSLTINDAAGVKSDTVKIELDDRGNRLIEPPDGAIILVFLGYEGMPLFPMGIFILDRVEYDIAPDRMIIHGKAADFGGTLKEQKTRNWDEKTIGEIVETIAGEHDLAPRVADAFKDIKYEYLAQNAESDINFLTRIGKDHDALVSVKQLKDSEKRALLFTGRGEGKSASGLSLPQAWIFKSQVLPGSRITKSKATIYKSVEATWHNDETGDREAVLLGEGSPKFEITHPHATKDEAKRAAKSKLDEQARAAHTISVRLIGNPIYRAEGQMVAIGFRPSVPFLWSIKKVSHQLTNSGFTTQIDGELPKSE
jgi:phage protein D